MNWFKKLMIGRYGMDQLSNAMLMLSIVFLVVNSLIGSGIFNIFAMIILILCYARMFSKNINKRREENMKFLQWWNPIKLKLIQFVNRARGGKSYRYFKCTQCGQRLRVPRGKGKIRIICPKCRNEFTKNT
ncbi:zinc ribbon domain-containing protein [Lutispora sp.]|uniref:zinc ribbon domain-containing protein n=1 Tax=Lutispora sp. TaxID=2828727 RepID=UPI000EBF1E36|nr:zinc ribbon domain-containing protein [Lutispora sp.]MEA4960277.1 zinc ribbon domain-containing protein [Lutispora sp.]HCJ56199.1 hypothetical protein [Clostridiaceae bacterium]